MLEKAGQLLTDIADYVCGYPLLITLLGGGLILLFYSRFVSIRRIPEAIRTLRQSKAAGSGQISSAQALASAIAATVGMGNIAGVAIALAMGGPGAIFWMWISAIVGMATKYHEGVLAVKYRTTTPDGTTLGGPMHIVRNALSSRWLPLASIFAFAGMFGTLCIINANQLTEATMSTISSMTDIGSPLLCKTLIGLSIASIVALVVLGGVRRIATVASVLVPFMVGAYFILVLYIVATHLQQVPEAFASIFREALSLRAGWGALAGIAIIGARRAALVNEAGVGTASIMHSASSNTSPVREGLVAMLGPAIDSGFVCTLTALALILCGDLTDSSVKGLDMAMNAFSGAIPGGQYMLMVIVACFAISSMFSYSYYGTSCATYLYGQKARPYYIIFFIATLVIFAVIPLGVAIGLCDLFFALMVFPNMIILLRLRRHVKQETQAYFSK